MAGRGQNGSGGRRGGAWAIPPRGTQGAPCAHSVPAGRATAQASRAAGVSPPRQGPSRALGLQAALPSWQLRGPGSPASPRPAGQAPRPWPLCSRAPLTRPGPPGSFPSCLTEGQLIRDVNSAGKILLLCHVISQNRGCHTPHVTGLPPPRGEEGALGAPEGSAGHTHPRRCERVGAPTGTGRREVWWHLRSRQERF